MPAERGVCGTEKAKRRGNKRKGRGKIFFFPQMMVDGAAFLSSFGEPDDELLGRPAVVVATAARPARKAPPAKDVTTTRQRPLSRSQSDQNFAHRKQQIVSGLSNPSACDLSPKGSVDERCLPLMAVLNAHRDYVTTSSCSGRVALYYMTQSFQEEGGGEAQSQAVAAAASAVVPQPQPVCSSTASIEPATEAIACEQHHRGKTVAKKGGGEHTGWLYVTHEPTRAMVADIAAAFVAFRDAQPSGDREPQTRSDGGSRVSVPSPRTSMPVGPVEDENEYVSSSATMTTTTVSLKMEPFVMHVQCRHVEAAQRLLLLALQCGFRNSGVIPGSPKVMLAIRHTMGADAALWIDGVDCLGPSVVTATTTTAAAATVAAVTDALDDVVVGRTLTASSQRYLAALTGLFERKMKENFRRMNLLFDAVRRELSLSQDCAE